MGGVPSYLRWDQLDSSSLVLVCLAVLGAAAAVLIKIGVLRWRYTRRMQLFRTLDNPDVTPAAPTKKRRNLFARTFRPGAGGDE